uniref:Uncharacterized protein n=1 Tax=Arundo donax TaxID=35708 RepID=A0A0A8YR79_ARUDO
MGPIELPLLPHMTLELALAAGALCRHMNSAPPPLLPQALELLPK